MKKLWFAIPALLVAGVAHADCPPGPMQHSCQQNEQVAAQRQQMANHQRLVAEKQLAEAILYRQLRDAKDPEFFIKLSDADLAAYPAKIRAEDAQVAAIDRDLGVAVPDTSQTEALTASLVQKEQACRQDKKCLTNRQAAVLAQQICFAYAQGLQGRAEIRRERANPSGVVDLESLHDSGELVQNSDEQVAAGKAAYAKLTGRPFSTASCK